jgi:hypothetical protein
MAARLEALRAGVRPVTVSAPARRAGVAWPRLPAAAYSGHASRTSLETYSRLALPGAQAIYDGVIGQFPV